MAKYKVAIIACGQIARSHAYGWQGVPDTEIWAIADTSENARQEFGDHFGVAPERRYSDYREMLDKEHPDLVSICSWHLQHAEMVIAAAARKPKGIISDKPMATSLGEADEMAIACQRERVKLVIGHQRRFHSVWAEAARLVSSGAIGRPLHASVVTDHGLLNSATHSIDLMRYLLGDPDADWVMGNVQRRTDQNERSIPSEEVAIGAIGFSSGAVGSVVSGAPRIDERQPMSCRIFATEGTIEVGVRSGDPSTHPLRDDGAMRMPEQAPSARYNDEEGVARYFSLETNAWKNVEMPWIDPFVAEMQELVDWVTGKVQTHRGAASQGRATLEITMAIYESARCHELVRIPMETRVNPLRQMIDDGHLPVSRPGAYELRASLVRGEGMSWYR